MAGGTAAGYARSYSYDPAGRLTTPEDIANTCVALLDPRVEWVNGTVIKVDCGEDNI